MHLVFEVIITMKNLLLRSSIKCRWWQHWIDYVNQEQPNNPNDVSEHCDSASSSTLKRPAGIDNSDLVYDAASEDTNAGIEIQDTLLEGRDYVLLPQQVWNQLHTWSVDVVPA